MSSEISEGLRTLLLDVEAYESGRRYVYFDRVWHHPDSLRVCAELIYHYILQLGQQPGNLELPDKSELVILSPDAVRSNFGIIPVSVLVADKIGCRFAVWKELADIRWGTSAVMGSTTPGLICIVLQDVVSRGHYAIRMARAMKDLDWAFRAYVGVVLNNPEGDAPVRSTLKEVDSILGATPEFRYILSAQELR